MADPLQRHGRRSDRDLAGAARRLVRLVPDGGERGEDRARAASSPLTRIVSAGNVAGEGAKIAALSVTERAAASAVLDEVDYVELSGRTDFNDLFIDQLRFPG